MTRHQLPVHQWEIKYEETKKILNLRQRKAQNFPLFLFYWSGSLAFFSFMGSFSSPYFSVFIFTLQTWMNSFLLAALTLFNKTLKN